VDLFPDLVPCVGVGLNLSIAAWSSSGKSGNSNFTKVEAKSAFRLCLEASPPHFAMNALSWLTFDGRSRCNVQWERRGRVACEKRCR
jgi:hypothetical protein